MRIPALTQKKMPVTTMVVVKELGVLTVEMTIDVSKSMPK